MLSVLQTAQGYVYAMYAYMRNSWPLSLLIGLRSPLPSASTSNCILRLIRLLQALPAEGGDAEEVLSLIRSLPSDENLLEVVAEDGYNALQHAVVCGCQEAVLALLDLCGMGQPQCSPPAHLAALQGHSSILQILLDKGASGRAKRGMCFPLPHRSTEERPALLGFSHRPVFRCQKHCLTPLQCAIAGDSVECVELLLQVQAPRQKSNSFYLSHLHYTCREGATRCLSYFVKTFPGIINKYNSLGDTPLLTAVPWGWECVKILVDNGADVHMVSKTMGETALHRLYRMNIDGLFSIYDTTNFLLTTGIEQNINALTSLQESPLHMLVSHISYAGGNFVDQARRTVPRSSLQKDYQDQVVRALQAILEFNADPHLLNGEGLQALSRMLHIALKACCRDDTCPCVQSSQPDKYIVEYKNDYSSLQKALEVLIQHGADVNFRCQVGHTPVILLLQCFLHDDVESLCLQREGVLAALRTLLFHGADLDFLAGNQGTCATLVAVVCQRYFSEFCKPELRSDFARLCNDILSLLLRYGLNPNFTSSKSCPYLRGGNGNAMIEFVRLTEMVQGAEDFAVIHRWLKTLLQWGANPDLEPYPCEPIICHSQSSIFLKKQGTQAVSHYIHKVREQGNLFADEEAQELLLLFYNSMEHRILYESLNSAKSMAGIHLMPHGNHDFLSLIHWLSENPRSLRQIARVAIYRALDHRLTDRVDKLPIPGALKTYLLEIA